MWPDRRLIDLFDIKVPIRQALIASTHTLAVAIVACNAGGWVCPVWNAGPCSNRW